jgi:hypothetical protein
MQPEGMIRCYHGMAALLYWIVYNFDLGPLGPTVLNLAVQSWLNRERDKGVVTDVRRQLSSFLCSFNLQPSLRADGRM